MADQKYIDAEQIEKLEKRFKRKKERIIEQYKGIIDEVAGYKEGKQLGNVVNNAASITEKINVIITQLDDIITNYIKFLENKRMRVLEIDTEQAKSIENVLDKAKSSITQKAQPTQTHETKNAKLDDGDPTKRPNGEDSGFQAKPAEARGTSKSNPDQKQGNITPDAATESKPLTTEKSSHSSSPESTKTGEAKTSTQPQGETAKPTSVPHAGVGGNPSSNSSSSNTNSNQSNNYTAPSSSQENFFNDSPSSYDSLAQDLGINTPTTVTRAWDSNDYSDSYLSNDLGNINSYTPASIEFDNTPSIDTVNYDMPIDENYGF